MRGTRAAGADPSEDQAPGHGSGSPMEGEEEAAARAHPASPSGERPFPFPAWEESSGDENVLVIHSQVEEEEHKCLLCGEVFGQPLSLLRHQKQQHAGERTFVCPECGRGFSLKHNLIIHQRIHTGEKPFGCGVCGKRFSLKQNLLTHQRVHGGQRPFACPACGKGFREQRLLLAHQKGACGGGGGTAAQEKQGPPGPPRMQTRGRPRAAGERGEGFRQQQQQQQQRPLRVKPQKPHPNGAAFACRECGQAFVGKSGLASHQRMHRAERPLQAGEGGRRCFGGPQEAGPQGPNQRLHGGEAPFQCLTCGKNFAQKDNLAAHRRSHLHQETLS
ncbi:zinc finger protein 776-like [Elgaria multicarinata webbii]|uniref:zinc finger protein 776-like n=1 Tax=Elgaria multicarinata webbii TaxID=159646 RepID=UPI002FCD3FE5